jgi:RNA polymerase sigma-70 factor (ECF subfamily)
MILACCHASLSPRESIAVTLRLVCGLGLTEIAAGILSTPANAKKLLARAKFKIRDNNVPFELGQADDPARRLDRAMQTVYLLFNEGYAAHTGDALVRGELCREAQRLAELLLASRLGDTPSLWALAALMAFQAARLPARAEADGRIILLPDQDRTLWDGALLDHGRQCLERSMTGNVRSAYHLEAAIAGCHAAAPNYDATGWRQIRLFYDDLIDLTGSPVAAMNRAVAVMMEEGPEAGLAALEPLHDHRRLANDYLLPALAADFHRRAGNQVAAEEHYRESLARASNAPVRHFLSDQMSACSIA